jgi:Delta7-sterol 5-desaturase
MEVIKQILSTIPQGFITGLVLNGSLVTIVYYLFWKKFKERFKNFRIQIKQKVNNKQIKREIKNAFSTLLVSSILSSIVIYLSLHGQTKIYTDVSKHNFIYSLSCILLLLVIDDTWFYWCHRLLHHPKVFRFVHFEHHKSTDVNPFTSLSFHFIEPILLTLWIIPVALFIPIYAPVLLFVQFYGMIENVKSHLGYEFFPSNFNKSWLRFLTTSTHHNMHHQKFKGNYGIHFRIWDKLLKTEFEDYEQEYQNIQTRKKSTK